jgi:hypothetical protein
VSELIIAQTNCAVRTVDRKKKRANAWQYRISVEAKG